MLLLKKIYLKVTVYLIALWLRIYESDIFELRIKT